VAAHVELSAGRAGAASDSLLRIQSEFWLLLVAPLAVGGALLGGRALDLMYGEAAAGAANTCALLFGALALQQLSGLGKDALQGRGRDGVPSRAHAFGGVLNLAGSVALIPLLGAAGAAAATLAAALLTVVMQSRVLRADGHVPFAARTVRVVLVALAIMTTTVLTAGRLVSLPAAAALAVQIAAGAAAYAAVLLVLRPRSSLGSGFAAGPAPLRLVSHLL
jgi:O-antigen/teichoic acid export membrane protein